MGLFQTIKGFFTRNTKSLGTGLDIPSLSTYSHNFLRRMNTKQYLEAYTGRTYTCVSVIAESVSTLDFVLENKKGEAIDHENLQQITPELLESIVSFMKLSGTCYIWKVMAGKKVLASYILRPDLMSAKKDNTGKVIQWEYMAGGKIIHFQPEEIVVFANFHPFQTYPNTTHGYSEVQASAITSKLDEASEVWNRKRFTNSAQAGQVVKTKSNMTPEQQEKLTEQRYAKFGGVNNAHKLVVLAGGLELVDPKPAQKEMDFVNGQRWSMEKILAIFKVPKAMLGMGEGVNVGNVKAFDEIFARRTISPLAKKIARIITKNYFDGVGTFKFINVIPKNAEEIKGHYLAGGITLNEYRKALGHARDKQGDRYIDDTEYVPENSTGPKKEFVEKETSVKSFLSIVNKHTPGTEAYNEERWQQKVHRNDTYEETYKKILKRIFALQEKDILGQIKDEKSVKKINIPKIGQKYIALYLSLLKKPQKKILEKEGKVAMDELGIDARFNVMTPAMVARQKENILQLAKGVDSVTNEKIAKIIGQAVDNGLAPVEVRNSLKQVFTELSTKRADLIVRTETIRTGTKAQLEAWKQSGVVKEKQWYTALDERVCEHCNALHGKVIPLEKDFFKKGETFIGERGGKMKLDYSDTPGSPLHPQCRCDLLPITE